MSTFYQYQYPSELIQDLQNQKKIYFEKGLISTITVASKKPEEDGFIMIFAYNYNSIFQNVSRYSFTLIQFQQLTFSQESVGLYYYTTIDPINNIETNWTNNILSAGQKSDYINSAYNMLRQNFVAKWKLNWNLQPTPAPIIEVSNLSQVIIPNNGAYIGSDVVTGSVGQFKFIIKNKGTSRLDISSVNIGGFLLGPGESVNITDIEDSLLPNVDEVEVTLNYTLIDQTVRDFIVSIETNDPKLPIFNFNYQFTVNAVPAPILVTEKVNSNFEFIFDRFDISPSPNLVDIKAFTLKIKNTGNAPMELQNIEIPQIEIPGGSGDLYVMVFMGITPIFPTIINTGQEIDVSINCRIPTGLNFALDLDNYLLNNPAERYIKFLVPITITTDVGMTVESVIIFYY
jgi:archaellum component FlaG (FlaF/FlaG flagellin family)